MAQAQQLISLLLGNAIVKNKTQITEHSFYTFDCFLC